MFGLSRRGGEMVGPGDYWNLTTGERVHLTSESVLPGDAMTGYHKLPPLAMLLLAPFLGLLYALFLPFIGIAMLIGVVARKLFGGFVEGLWRAASFGWRPSEAYLLGRKGKKADKKAAEDKPEHPSKS